MTRHHPIAEQARQVSLLRLLLVALALAMLVFAIEGRQQQLAPESLWWARWLLICVGVTSGLLSVAVKWTRSVWQIVLHLVFDLLWVGLLIYLTGGVASPAVPLLFAVVLIANLVLPGAVPFVMPALAALVMASTAALYLGRSSPFPEEFLNSYPMLADTNRIIGNLGVQIGGVFVVDLLAQLLGKRLSEQRLFTNELLDQLGEGVIAIDRLGAIVYINDEARRVIHLPDSPVYGQLVTVILGAPHHTELLELATTDVLPQIRRLQGVNGRCLMVRATQLIGRNGKTFGRTILVADETRLRVLEDNAQRSEHLSSLGEMAAGIAHEVRNPLTSLRGCAQELADICASSKLPDAAALAGILVNESDRLARIVSDFLTLSRLRKPDRQPVDLEPLLDELTRMIRLRADLPPGLSFTIKFHDETPSILADVDQVKQVFQNLINNSLDAVRDNGVPTVSCTIERAVEENPLDMPAVVIRVTDNGCGIPLEFQQRIFTPFFSTKAQGTGLGLSLVNRIVREHEGLLELHSKPGEGTTVTIYLPAHSQTRTFRRALGGG